MANITEEEIEKSLITDKIYRNFMSKKTILSKDRRTGIDMWISNHRYPLLQIPESCYLQIESLLRKRHDPYFFDPL